jgi:hypothetical protein
MAKVTQLNVNGSTLAVDAEACCAINWILREASTGAAKGSAALARC